MLAFLNYERGGEGVLQLAVAPALAQRAPGSLGGRLRVLPLGIFSMATMERNLLVLGKGGKPGPLGRWGEDLNIPGRERGRMRVQLGRHGGHLSFHPGP